MTTFSGNAPATTVLVENTVTSFTFDFQNYSE